ncbi:MAG: hypothetical protein AAGK32_21980, partial [Actinomycetota bacterium]
GDLSRIDPGGVVAFYNEDTITAPLTNTAATTATPVDRNDATLVSPTEVSDSDDAAVAVLTPDVSIDKTVYLDHDSGAGCPGGELSTGVDGQAVTYCFSVTNTGEVPLDVVIDDADLGITSADMQVLSGSLTGLPVGGTVELYFDATITADLVNDADVTGTTPAGDQVTDTDDAEVDLVAPSISIDKTVYLGHDSGAGCAGSDLVADELGQPVTYCIEVTNTGDTVLTDAAVQDLDLGIDDTDLQLVSGDLSRIDPGGVVAFYNEDTITAPLT